VIGTFFAVWYQLTYILCFITFLGGGLPALFALFYPIVFLCGILGFVSTSVVMDKIGRETSQQLRK
jgi:hypothetical protein